MHFVRAIFIVRATVRAIFTVRATDRFSPVPYGCMNHKCDVAIFRGWQSSRLHFPINSVDTFSEFLHIAIVMQKGCNLRIA